jgi:hypothetical protein
VGSDRILTNPDNTTRIEVEVVIGEEREKHTILKGINRI